MKTVGSGAFGKRASIMLAVFSVSFLASAGPNAQKTSPEVRLKEAFSKASIIRLIVTESYKKVDKEFSLYIFDDISEIIRAAGYEIFDPDMPRFDATISIRASGRPLGASYQEKGTSIVKYLYTGASFSGEICFEDPSGHKKSVKFSSLISTPAEYSAILSGPEPPEQAPWVAVYEAKGGSIDQVIKLLGEIGGTQRLKNILDVWPSNKTLVPERTARILAGMKIDETIAALRTALSNRPDGGMQEIILAALEDVGWSPSTDEEKILWFVAKEKFEEAILMGEPALPGLIAALLSPRPIIQSQAESALEKINQEWPKSQAAHSAVPMLMKGLIHESEETRGGAERVLEKIDPDWTRSEAARAAVPGYLAALRDRVSTVRQAALNTLDRIDPAWPETEAARAAIPDFLAALWHDLPAVRMSAAAALDRIHPDWIRSKEARDALPILIDTLKGEDDVYQRAAAILEQIDPAWPRSEAARQAVPGLIKGLAFSWGAIKALEAIGDPRAVDPLLNVLKTERLPYRAEAARALGTIGDRRAIEPLLKIFVETENPKALTYVRDPMLDALTEIDPNWRELPAARAIVSRLIAGLRAERREDRQSAAQSLGGFGDPAAVDDLIGVLEDEDHHVRWMAAIALGDIGDPRAIDALTGLLINQELVVRMAATEALGKIGDPRVLETLAGLLLDHQVEEEAIYGLAALRDRRAIGPLVRALGSTHPQGSAPRYLVNALDDIDPDWRKSDEALAAVPELIAALKSTDEIKAWASALALGHIGDSRAVVPFLETLKDRYGYWTLGIVPALGELGDARAVEPLVQALKDGGGKETAQALGAIGDRRAEEPLRAILKDVDPEVRAAAAGALAKVNPEWIESDAGKAALDELAADLKDESWQLRRTAAETLGGMTSRRAVEILISSIKEGDDNLQTIAAEALRGHRESKVVDSLLLALEDTDDSVRAAAAAALGEAGEKRAFESLVRALSGGRQDVRRAAAVALGQIGDSRALEPLRVATKDRFLEVRSAALAALEKLEKN